MIYITDARECAFGDLYPMEAMDVDGPAFLFINEHEFGRWLIINGMSASGHINKRNDPVREHDPFTRQPAI